MTDAAVPSSVLRRGRFLSGLSNVLYAVGGIAVALALWEFYVRWRDVGIFIAPAPTEIFGRIFEMWQDLLYHLMHTLFAAGLGLVVGATVGTFAGIVMAQWKVLERSLFPLAVLVRLTPFVALVPLLLVWLGPGIKPKIVIAALISFFPFVVNSISGLRSADLETVDLVKTLGGSNAEIFRRVRWPTTKPYLFGALKLSVSLSLIGAIVAEFYGAFNGIGKTIFVAGDKLDMRTMFAGIFVLAAAGVVLTMSTLAVERRVLHWHESVRSSEKTRRIG